MKNLQYLFGVKTGIRSAKIEEDTFPSVVDSNEPESSLFSEDDAPMQNKRGIRESGSVTLITEFLNRDFLYIGRRDGYYYHNQEILETGKKKIKAEFILILDQAIEDKIERKLELTNMAIEVASVSPSSRLQLEKTIEELESSIDVLQMQKELSIGNEGWVMNPIHSYHQGFLYGLNDWIKREDLFKSIRNL